ncbi:helix-turn-helix transcriptional regulator [Arthrobacter citreus]|nr:helix-turn-helix transcriptional regulator [Arthrobacter citreus]
MENKTFKAIRLYFDYTQSEYAKLLNLDHSYISQIERGHKRVPERARIKLIKELNITPNLLSEIKQINQTM